MSFKNGSSVGLFSAVQWKYPPRTLATSSAIGVVTAASAAGVDDAARVRSFTSTSGVSVSSPFSGSDAGAFAGVSSFVVFPRASPSTRTGSVTVVARDSSMRKYFCNRRSATNASAHRDKHRG
eukprot:30936-Pelagococcus_subviridis.AAC.28